MTQSSHSQPPWWRWPLAALLWCLALSCTNQLIPVERFDICNCGDDELCIEESCVSIDRILATGTLNDDSSSGTTSTTTCASSIVRVEELAVGDENSPGFIELAGPAQASLDNYRLLATDRLGQPVLNLTLSGTLSSQGLWTAALGSGLDAADQTLQGISLSAPVGNVLLFDCDGRRLDAVGYGTFSQEDLYRGEGSAAPELTEGEAIGRCPGNDDSDDNGQDFLALPMPSPGVANVCP